mgnify:CR=1 FL=1
MKFIFIFFVSFLNLFISNRSLSAAEIINIKFEEMIIPISIDKLSKLETYKDDSTELTDWINSNGLKKIFELSKILEYPVFKERGFSKQILSSWIGRKVISELGKTIIVQGDKEGIIVSNTIKDLLLINNEVSTLDVLKAIPVEEIELDIDNLILIVSSWKRDLFEQQNLVDKLNEIEESKENLNINLEENLIITDSIMQSIIVTHREEPLALEFWKPKNLSDKELIIFMPGLGGDINNFSWIGEELSKRGWPVIFIDHAGSNSIALKDVMEGQKDLPEAHDFYLNRLLDLESVILAHENNKFSLSNSSYILMGHSLGTLIAFLYEGEFKQNNFETLCQNAFSDFALTNLSKLLQCQLTEVSLPIFNPSSNLSAIVGFNGFGSLIWPKERESGIEVPILLIGGTFDLVTPLMGEQFNLFLSNSYNSLNRFLVIEGASHFSPIRINNENFDGEKEEDVFRINQTFIGANPYNVQKLSIEIIIDFLEGLEEEQGLSTFYKQNEFELNFHILDSNNVKDMFKDQ